jgi:hypothetical protein
MYKVTCRRVEFERILEEVAVVVQQSSDNPVVATTNLYNLEGSILF